MWYVLRCKQGEEQSILYSLKQHLSDRILKEAFVFTYDRMKRYHGQWHVESLAMFPNYIFLESDYGEALSRELEPYRGIVHVMEDHEILWQVYSEEEKFLRFLCGQEHHLDLSRGYIRNGITHVNEGPLRGLENRIQKIDRHKRTARLQVPMEHRLAGTILAGLEIVEKS